jgi:hypothetical protein
MMRLESEREAGARVGVVAALAFVVAGAGLMAAGQSNKLPAGISGAKAKELHSAMTAKKLEAYAIRDSSAEGRYAAVMLVPNVQLLVVSAQYERPSDIEYRLYHKDYATAYADLRSSVLAKDRFFVEDAFCDGLKAQPPKKPPVFDQVMMDNEKQIFDGVFVESPRRNDTRLSREEYTKRAVAADARYAQLLTMLIDALK